MIHIKEIEFTWERMFLTVYYYADDGEVVNAVNQENGDFLDILSDVYLDKFYDDFTKFMEKGE